MCQTRSRSACACARARVCAKISTIPINFEQTYRVIQIYYCYYFGAGIIADNYYRSFYTCALQHNRNIIRDLWRIF